MGRTAWTGAAAVMLAAAAAFTPAAHADSAYSAVNPLPPLIVQPTPVRTWVPGHWEQSPFGNVWVEGHWIVLQPQQFQQFQFQQFPLRRGPGWQGAHFDRDRDGIPDRFDRDRDGDGVPNRRDRAPGDWRRR